MDLDGLHLVITYQCTFECDHCFVWGSPWQNGTMTLETVRTILAQAKEVPSIEWIYFEGGEPFLYYQLMVAGINEAHAMGFNVGVVTNSYWATSEDDTLQWLSPLSGKVQDLTISSDLFHFSEIASKQSVFVSRVADRLDMPFGIISIEQPEVDAVSSIGQIPQSTSSIMYRGRAADKLAQKSSLQSIEMFTECPHENLLDPGRVHIDPFGNLHICQGLSIGNIHEASIKEICSNYDPSAHPILGPLLSGGPRKLTEEFHITTKEKYADACHLCYNTRKFLRHQFPLILCPDQMYGVSSDS